VIGFLHSDDVYAHERVIEEVVGVFEKTDVDSVYGDLLYVDKKDIHKVIRSWKSSRYRRGKFRYGWMPPHPTFFVKKRVYDEYGYFDAKFRIAADYELMLRFLEKYGISSRYIPRILVKMRVGGLSNKSLRNMFIKSSEDYRAWKVNNLSGGLGTIILKNVTKIPQFFK